MNKQAIIELCRDMEERSNMAGVGTDAKNHWEQGFRSACRTIRREIEKSEDTNETTPEND